MAYQAHHHLRWSLLLIVKIERNLSVNKPEVLLFNV